VKLRRFRREVHGDQDLSGDGLVLDEGDQAERSLALGAEDLKPENPAQQVRPPDVLGFPLGFVLAGVSVGGGGRAGNHLFAGRGMRGKDTTVKDGMPPWGRNQGSEARNEGERRKLDGTGAIGPRAAGLGPMAGPGLRALAALDMEQPGKARPLAPPVADIDYFSGRGMP
jgi:hypothetical protein